jgi:serine/threonine protein phosphatase PrpC
VSPLQPTSCSVTRLLHCESAARTHCGRVRESNEDAFIADGELGLFAVADGLGGRPAGEVASAMAVAAVRDILVSTDRATRHPVGPVLTAAVAEANLRVFATAAQDPAKEGMGTTFTGALARGTSIALAHVGDSRAYLLHGRRLDRLTQDHNIQSDARWAALDGEQRAALEHVRFALTRAVGTDERVDVDVHTLEPQDGDVLLLCSDGLTAVLSEREIGCILLEHAGLDEAADWLVARANELGGPDNVTVVLVRWFARGESRGQA